MLPAFCSATWTTNHLTTTTTVTSLLSFIAICKPVILDEMKSYGYTYTFHTSNDLPHTLADLHTAGMFASDGQAMMCIGPKRPLGQLPPLKTHGRTKIHKLSSSTTVFTYLLTSLASMRPSRPTSTPASPFIRSPESSILQVTPFKRIPYCRTLKSEATDLATAVALSTSQRCPLSPSLLNPLGCLRRTNNGKYCDPSTCGNYSRSSQTQHTIASFTNYESSIYTEVMRDCCCEKTYPVLPARQLYLRNVRM